MSILANPQVRPSLLWAALRFLRTSGAQPDHAEMVKWFAPAGAPTRGASEHGTAELVRHIRDAGQTLGFLDTGAAKWQPTADLPEDWAAFGDRIHDAFISSPAGSEFVDAYALIVALTEAEGFQRLLTTNAAFADSWVKPAADGFVAFNKERLAAFIDWTETAGMGVHGPSPVVYHPFPAMRLERELRRAFEVGEQVPASTLMDLLSVRLPYLDGGRAYVAAQKHLTQRSDRVLPKAQPKHLTGVLSNALRVLEKWGRIGLSHGGGDTMDYRILGHGASARGTDATAITVRAGEDSDAVAFTHTQVAFTHLALA